MTNRAPTCGVRFRAASRWWFASGVALSALLIPMAVAASDPFDPPLKIRHVELKPDPQNPHVKRRISCFYDRSIVVKQVDYGEVGAERLALLPVLADNATPCRDGKESYEYEIPNDRWSGYFRGAKADYAFFDAPDGTNGGLGFMVLRVVDRKVLFEDTAEHGIQSIEVLDAGRLKLRYQRVYQGNCSAVSGGEPCRLTLSGDTGVATASLASCGAGYVAAKQVMAKGRCAAQGSKQSDCLGRELAMLDEQRWNEAPIVIVYEVEVTLGAATPVITRRSDALACRPSD